MRDIDNQKQTEEQKEEFREKMRQSCGIKDKPKSTVEKKHKAGHGVICYAVDGVLICAECGEHYEPEQECCQCYCEKCKDCFKVPCKIHSPTVPTEKEEWVQKYKYELDCVIEDMEGYDTDTKFMGHKISYQDELFIRIVKFTSDFIRTLLSENDKKWETKIDKVLKEVYQEEGLALVSSVREKLKVK